MSFVTGVGLTPFGRLDQDTLGLMSMAASAALDDAGLERREVDGLLTGYSTTFPHLMLATVFAERFGLQPQYAHGVQAGGATGCAMVMLAHCLVDAGVLRHVLVVAGENRATGQTTDASVQTLAQVGHATHEVPLGATVPAYYALLASRYMAEFGIGEADLAALAVLMRKNAAMHPGAHRRQQATLDEVLASRPIAHPLKLLDCCPISDGAAAVVVSAERLHDRSITIVGTAQRHQHQHVSALGEIADTGAGSCARQALHAAGLALNAIEFAGIYDSFTITLTMLLEEIGFCARGQAGRDAVGGRFDRDGALPLNTHGGLLGYGHCGVGGGMAHLVEAGLQMIGRAGVRQLAHVPATALVHGDGGVMSSHVSLVLRGPE